MNAQKQILAFGIIFISIFTILFINIRMDYLSTIKITQKEIKGLKDIVNIHNLNIAIKERRGLNQLKNDDRNNLKKMLFITEEDISTQIKNLQDKKIEKLYQDIISSINISKKSSFKEYTKILTLLERKKFDIADSSYLLFESQRELYFLMSIAILDIPDTIENIAVIRAIGTRIITNGTLNQQDIMLLSNNIQMFLNRIDKIKFILPKLNFNDASTLNILIDSIMTDFYVLSNLIGQVQNKSSDIKASEYFLGATKLVNNINNLLIASKTMLKNKLINREEYISNKIFYAFILYLLIVIIILAATLITFIKTKKSISLEKEKQDEVKFLTFLKDEYSKGLSLKELSDISLKHIINYFGALNGSIYLYNKDNNKLYLGSLYGLKIDTLEQTLNINENIISENILEKKINIQDVNEKVSLGNIKVTGTKLVTVPILEFDNSIGTIQLLFKNNFKDINKEFLQESISLIGNYIFKAQKDDETSKYIQLIDKNVLISKTDLDGKIIEASEEFCNISGYTRDELLGQNHRLLRHIETPKELFVDMWKTITSGNTWRGELKNKKKDGGFYWIDSVITPDCDINGNVLGYTAIRTDITNKKTIEQIAITDGLTSLYNRRHFDTIFSQQIEISKRAKGILAFVLIDIDHFKQYNDTYGHQDGDTTLKLVANALKQTLNRPDDYTFRLGGEEFGLLYHISDEDDAEIIANKARINIENLKIDHTGNSASKYVTISSGLYIIKAEDKNSEDTIYKKSDEALYISKQNGRNKVTTVQ